MKMKYPVALAAIAAVAALGLSGCAASSLDNGAPPETTEVDSAGAHLSDGLKESKIRLSDGREITCIIYTGIRKGGLSCDWENVKER